MKHKKYILPKPIYPHFVLKDFVQLFDEVGFEFYLPESERCKTLKEGDLVKVFAHCREYLDQKPTEGTGELWLRVEMILPKYEIYIGRAIDTNFIESVLKSKIQYIPFFERNIADIFQPDVDLIANLKLQQKLDGQE